MNFIFVPFTRSQSYNTKLAFMRLVILSFFLLFVFSHCGSEQASVQPMQKLMERPALKLMQKVINRAGTYADLHKLDNVEYNYIVDDVQAKTIQQSQERYIFDGEVSWARYENTDVTQLYSSEGIKVYNAQHPVQDLDQLQAARFARKSNFYWFTMMQKLGDLGVNYEILEDRLVDSIHYKVVEMSFADFISESQNRLLLYVNPNTYIIDRLLYTVQGHEDSSTQPLLMILDYSDYNDVLLPTQRSIFQSNWQGDKGAQLYIQFCRNMQFQNDFDVLDLDIL